MLHAIFNPSTPFAPAASAPPPPGSGGSASPPSAVAAAAPPEVVDLEREAVRLAEQGHVDAALARFDQVQRK